MKTERTLFTLSQNQRSIWNTYDLCRNACEKMVAMFTMMLSDDQIKYDVAEGLIYATAKKHEDNEKARNQVYDKICKDYNLKEEELDRLEINPINGVVRIVDKSYNEEDMQKKRFKRLWR
jgi:hypothetical protein